MKNLITGILAILTIAQLSFCGNGGFATGAILGTGITLAATRGSRNSDRSPDYYENRRIERNRIETNREIEREEQKIKNLNSRIRKQEKELQRLQDKNGSESQINDKKADIADNKRSLKKSKNYVRKLKNNLYNTDEEEDDYEDDRDNDRDDY